MNGTNNFDKLEKSHGGKKDAVQQFWGSKGNEKEAKVQQEYKKGGREKKTHLLTAKESRGVYDVKERGLSR